MFGWKISSGGRSAGRETGEKRVDCNNRHPGAQQQMSRSGGKAVERAGFEQQSDREIRMSVFAGMATNVRGQARQKRCYQNGDSYRLPDMPDSAHEIA
jgi:hypothetical protein